jgi:hypothetical protein
MEMIQMRRRLGDRSDGHRLKKADPFFRIIPHIMKNRSDAQVFFEERIYLEKPQLLIRKLRKEGYKVGFLHIVVATMIRVMSQKPKINRFINGKKAYSRNDLSLSLAIKKDMTEDGEETTIKVFFEPTDTIYDICDKLNAAIEENKVVNTENNADKMAKILNHLPNFILSGVIGFLKWLDRMGHLPKFIIKLSPFHCTMFVTDLGSIGIKPVYHHIYDFGTTSIFISFGLRSREQHITDELTINNKKAMDLKIVVDERIVDGFYFASAMKLASKIMNNPEVLLEKPETVVIDNEI